MTDNAVPLSARMRPSRLEEYIGQEHILGSGKPLRKAIEKGQPGSMVLWGPPGCGKTTLARLVSAYTGFAFEEFSAVTSGVPDLRRVIAAARERLDNAGHRTILFVDEIHRFNKAQQDAFLPHIEAGTIILIGATTEKPFYSLNAPLLSRARVYQLRSLDRENIIAILQRALATDDLLLSLEATIDDEAMEWLAAKVQGDSRLALDALEMAVLTFTAPPARIDLELMADVLQQKALRFGTNEHYDLISAYIKSMRGSDPDAAVYWLARMLAAGEDPRFIARRLIIQASEDVGNADPMALVLANSALQAVAEVGMPEARIPLAQATIYVACAPKSNASYKAIAAAMDAVENMENMPVPSNITGHPDGYRYPHDAPGHFLKQTYLPANVRESRFYQPAEHGYEAKIGKRIEEWWGKR